VYAALLSGNGFNFIPLAAKQLSYNRSVTTRPGLFTAKVAGVRNLVRSTKQRVWRLPEGMAERLVRSVADEADVLVLDPIEPDVAELK
jgi:hypothetical protein